MAGFLEELHATSNIICKCKVGVWMDGLNDDYRAEVVEAFGGDFETRSIWRVIVNREGQVFSESVLSRHRKGECSCGIS